MLFNREINDSFNLKSEKQLVFDLLQHKMMASLNSIKMKKVCYCETRKYIIF